VECGVARVMCWLVSSDSERSTRLSNSILRVNLPLSRIVSEIMCFFCKREMTSCWYFRKGALRVFYIFWLWKDVSDFLIVFYSNFTPNSRHSEIMTSCCYLRQGALYIIPNDGVWQSEAIVVFMLHWHVLPIFFNCPSVSRSIFSFRSWVTCCWWFRGN